MKNANKPVVNNQNRVATSMQTAYSGPIPDPLSLEKYEKIQPGFADRIISMAEKEASHRHEVDNFLIKKSNAIATLGIIFAFLSVIIFGLLIFYALYKGLNVATLGVAIGAIASVASIFIIMRSRKK